MKKYLLLFVAILLATTARAYVGETFTFEGLKYEVLSETEHTVKVSRYPQVSGEVNIPYFVTNNNSRYVVTSIGKQAFSGCSLSSVTIPNSVTSIDEYAFSQCSSLTSITIPNSVTEIGVGAFKGCSSLTSVTIPNSVTYIGDGSFSACTNLKEIIVEAGNEYYCCENGVLFNYDMTELIQCPGSKTEFDIPNSVLQIHDYAFRDCGNLIWVTIPNSVVSLGDRAFASCTSLTSVTIPNSVWWIGSCAFQDCTSLTSMTIPNSVTSIHNSVFSGCTSLTSVTIPNSVTQIGDYAFASCTSLPCVTIPNSVTWIDESAFSGCSSLTKIIDLNPIPQKLEEGAFEGVPSDAVVYIPKGRYVAYMVADGWAKFSDFREMGAFDITISTSTLELTEGESAELTVTITKDDDVTVGDHEWTSSNPEVATVEDGKVTAVALGSAVITYTIYDGYGVAHSESCKVTVKAPPVLVGSITLDKTNIEAQEGSEVQLTATVTPDNATNKEIAWSSSDEAVATVDETGLVKILKEGTCVITASTTDGSDLKAECTVTVKAPAVLVGSITLDKTNVEAQEGSEVQLTATVTPDDATNKEIAWSSSDENVATVSETGLVKILKEGTCVITAATTDGSDLKAECTVSALSGINDILGDTTTDTDVFTLQGIAVLHNATADAVNNLPVGLYIVRHGSTVKKIAVK